MGEEVTQSDTMLKNSAGIDETDKAATAPNNDGDACKVDEKCEIVVTNDGSEPEKSPKRPSAPKPQETSFEKSKKWYNISFMHRAANASNSRSPNTSDNQNSIKMDSRHSWHLNDSTEM
jgi:hypothetical protein